MEYQVLSEEKSVRLDIFKKLAKQLYRAVYSFLNWLRSPLDQWKYIKNFTQKIMARLATLFFSDNT